MIMLHQPRSAVEEQKSDWAPRSAADVGWAMQKAHSLPARNAYGSLARAPPGSRSIGEPTDKSNQPCEPPKYFVLRRHDTGELGCHPSPFPMPLAAHSQNKQGSWPKHVALRNKQHGCSIGWPLSKALEPLTSVADQLGS